MPPCGEKRGSREISLEQRINLDRIEQAAELFGSFDGNMRLVEQKYGVSLVFRDQELKISGEDPEAVDKAARVVRSLITLIGGGETLTEQNIHYCMQMVEEDSEDKVARLAGDCICITSKGKPVKPKTVGQRTYCDSIKENTITIGVGPAGTGKTYLAVAMAVTAFRAQQVNRIILTRPAVEAGEKLGFLPGDLQQKVDPYLRPLYDALFDMLGAETYQRYVERGNIEVAPLAYMRGRTLDDSFIILDEAQNTTGEQMKMFLTRLGFNSKMVITGDVTQIDLPEGKKSGLKEAVRILRGIDDIAVFRFTEKDVVRHRLVQDIIKAYERAGRPSGK
ncbi:MAG TPA: PhoH family protein [Candidatus Acutalibacter pullistercoris]|uniref:PhoH-like protein n=1 Tax=Candidatus Acutalibacter pullistercoris TaxID=2838418 RepID=A0A9D1YBJ4_9FIRM|nr:PhoH family protein [Candidatus Acutalibacter pullistercoris]